MATFFFGVNGPTLQFQQDLAIADADAPRIMAYLMNPFNGYGTVTEQGVTRVATPEEAAANYAQAVLASLLDATVAFEKAEAAKAAAESVAPISIV